MIPATQPPVLRLVEYGAVLAEVVLVAAIAYKAVQLRRGFREHASRGLDVYESLRRSARAVLGSVAGGVLAYEAAVIYYAVAGWSRSPRTDEESFTVHRNGGYAALMIAVTMALVVETLALHLLVRLWNPVAAWILTGISAYAMVWLVGDFHAVRLRPLQIAGGMLHVRVGLRWSVSVPLASIASAGAAAGETTTAGERCLKAVLVGAPNRRIELTEPASAIGPYGLMRRVKKIDLQIDEPERFDVALQTAGSG